VLQTLPEFAVEAVIAWEAGRNPDARISPIANLTGAIRLLLGLAADDLLRLRVFRTAPGRPARATDQAPAGARRRGDRPGSAAALLCVIVWKQSISWIDAVVLLLLYVGYLLVLLRNPPHTSKSSPTPRVRRNGPYGSAAGVAPRPSRAVRRGGFLLYVTAHPFLESMLAVAATLGISQFVLVQWVAPFLSEFPEKVSAFLWARRVTHARWR